MKRDIKIISLNILISATSKIMSFILRRRFNLTVLDHNGYLITRYPETDWLLAPFPAQKKPILNSDNLATANRAFFLESKLFLNAKNAAEERWRSQSSNSKVRDISWRLHVFLWAIDQAISQKAIYPDGMFVECGTGKGYMAAGALNYYGDKINPLYLVDTFEPNLVTHEAVKKSPACFAYANDFQEVEKYFSNYNNVYLIQGMIPKVLTALPEHPILFLHVDLNDATAEAEALNNLKSRLVKGSILLFDDFGGPGGEIQAKKHQAFAESMKLSLLTLPTGQAILVV